jgi:phosphoglycolate phosphatase
LSVRLAVFDIDGTLVDSREIIHRAACEAAACVGMAEPSYETVRRMVGLSLPDALRTLAPGMGEGDFHRFVEGYKDAFQRMHATPGFSEPLYDGAEALLYRLRRDGWALSMATGKSRRGVERWMGRDGWADLFASTHCADDGPGKPHPAMLLAAMERSGAQAERTVMIGDTSHDMAMARAAGVRAQGVAWGFQTAEEILAAGADHVAENFAELGAELDRFTGAGV